MKKMIIFEPALCCETGVCGVGVDPELLRISAELNALKKHNVIIDRFNLNMAPMEFIENKVINKHLSEKGVEGLPAVVLEGKIIITGRYPTNEEIQSLLEIPANFLTESQEVEIKESGGCSCSSEGCC
ncbi:MAG: arsenite efflux transporter metallochaperone ArsD [Lachnospirales bacterium]